jgi:methionyl-tRNA formyltransferase
MALRVIFMGTPDFAVPVLAAIAGQGHEIVAVYTQPPRPAGRRGLEPRKSPVHEKAELFNIPVRSPVSLKPESEQKALRELDADVAVVVAYGLILPPAVLTAPRLGCYNAHASLLPRWRGAAPIHRAIMAGDKETGVAVMKMDEGLDTGPVALVEKVSIGPQMTTGDLHDVLSALAADLIARALAALERGSLKLVAQPGGGVTYAEKISKSEARIDWSEPAETIDRKIRGLSPFPGAWCEVDLDKGPERLKLLRSVLASGKGDPGTILDRELTIACGKGAVRLSELQKAGGRPVDAAAFLRGSTLAPGSRFS